VQCEIKQAAIPEELRGELGEKRRSGQ